MSLKTRPVRYPLMGRHAGHRQRDKSGLNIPVPRDFITGHAPANQFGGRRPIRWTLWNLHQHLRYSSDLMGQFS
jgi:hypothetical protein